MLGLECNFEWVIELVLGHGSKSDVFWVGEVWFWRTVNVAKKLGDFSDTIGSVVEEENLVVIWGY